ncbi:MAG TPA: phosphoribosylglycinamide formyltransferase [Myxococcota bacterium]|nr:phosphoribosylglycinamide formyltransferase [Myxococcota bacterium]HPB51674.1 phosphoribosylglycinamide formyltransferase [Myxococcota bacterium]HQP96522.1 phosphoribosylglycinamide formyltransferase [Myxococcota bacterium]
MNATEGRKMVPIAILISGRGTNMTALIKAAARGELCADVRVVLSNKPEAAGLAFARAAGIPTVVLSHRDYPTREEYDRELVRELRSRGVEYVALAGFMRLLTPEFLNPFKGHVINIHPALLPAFPGIHSQRQALDYGVKITGCTVHFVDEGTDTGAIIAQRAVPVLDGDDEDSLSARILEHENALYPQALDDVLSGRVILDGGRTVRRT